MLKLDEILKSQTKRENIEGSWFSIQWSPDIGAGELHNIGVGFRSTDGALNVRMLDYFDRIECLYSKEAIFHVQLACDVAQESILTTGSTENISPQIQCHHKGFAQGKSESEILKKLYNSVVSLGHKKRIRASASTFTTINRDNFYTSLKGKLQVNLELDYIKHVPENPYHNVKDGNFSHKLYLPFRKEQGNATLVSAAYTNDQRVKCNLYDGSRDIDIAIEQLKSKNNAIFLIAPGDGLDVSKRTIIENDIDKFTWLMSRHNVHIDCETDEDILADRITDWCIRAA
ncbi:hypothetical protein [Vibrio cionasavignyae]|uniref:hypothetical protein n=1 Tax=Vibrio cionasavignyae TaxID=2910252 RepID=UPI003D0D3D17